MTPLRIETPACEMGGYIGGQPDSRNRKVAARNNLFKTLILLDFLDFQNAFDRPYVACDLRRNRKLARKLHFYLG